VRREGGEGVRFVLSKLNLLRFVKEMDR